MTPVIESLYCQNRVPALPRLWSHGHGALAVQKKVACREAATKWGGTTSMTPLVPMREGGFMLPPPSARSAGVTFRPAIAPREVTMFRFVCSLHPQPVPRVVAPRSLRSKQAFKR